MVLPQSSLLIIGLCILGVISSAHVKACPHVGFLARYIGSEINTGSHSTIMRYNVVVWNSGMGYNPRTGVFTAPVTGIYGFNVNALTGPSNKRVAPDLYHNGALVSNGWGQGAHATATINAALKLARGDTVTVRLWKYSNVDNDVGNSFSGFLISC